MGRGGKTGKDSRGTAEERQKCKLDSTSQSLFPKECPLSWVAEQCEPPDVRF